MEAMNLFIKEQFYLLKKLISEINSKTDATDNSITETTDLLRKSVEFLLHENASINTNHKNFSWKSTTRKQC